jgi:hypothetical protein
VSADRCAPGDCGIDELRRAVGLFGGCAIVLTYLLIAARGFKIAMLADDGFSKLLASGLTAAHLIALERLIEQPQDNLVLNCGYGKGLSVLEVLDALDRVLGKPVERREMPRRPGDAPELIASNRALVETLEWTPRFAYIDTIVAHALEWERLLLDQARA